MSKHPPYANELAYWLLEKEKGVIDKKECKQAIKEIKSKATYADVVKGQKLAAQKLKVKQKPKEDLEIVKKEYEVIDKSIYLPSISEDLYGEINIEDEYEFIK